MPDTSTFNCLLKACMRARDVKRADLALTWMRQAGVPADDITYNTLIKVRGQPWRGCCWHAGGPGSGAVWRVEVSA